MTPSTLMVFAAVALATIVTPGPTVLLAMNHGSRHGVRLASYGILGAVLSDFVLIGAAALGLGTLLAASELGFSIVKWLGVAYLAFLGVNLLRSRGPAAAPAAAAAEAPGNDARRVFCKGLFVALTNPKGYLFFAALLPQFIDPSAPALPQYALLAIVFASIDLAVMFGYALLGSRAAQVLRSAGARWLDRLCGGALLLLAGSLAAYRRSGA